MHLKTSKDLQEVFESLERLYRDKDDHFVIVNLPANGEDVSLATSITNKLELQDTLMSLGRETKESQRIVRSRKPDPTVN